MFAFETLLVLLFSRKQQDHNKNKWGPTKRRTSGQENRSCKNKQKANERQALRQLNKLKRKVHKLKYNKFINLKFKHIEKLYLEFDRWDERYGDMILDAYDCKWADCQIDWWLVCTFGRITTQNKGCIPFYEQWQVKVNTNENQCVPCNNRFNRCNIHQHEGEHFHHDGDEDIGRRKFHNFDDYGW